MTKLYGITLVAGTVLVAGCCGGSKSTHATRVERDRYVDNTEQVHSNPESGYSTQSGFVGPRGEAGPVGPAGEQGLTGSRGEQGFAVAGTRGEAGPAGPRGEEGLRGARGAEGSIAVGPSGEAGNVGRAGAQGSTGSTGTRGASGEGFAGPAGPAGPQGERGLTGDAGDRGNTLVGPSGAAGQAGLAGTQGERGEMGEQGNTSSGVAGQPGLAGPAGERGPTGETGPQGAVGNVRFWNSYREFWFDSQQTQLHNGDSKKIAQIVAYMKQNPSMIIGLDGTMPRNTSKAVTDMSVLRVKSIRDALINAGIPASRIKSGSFGDPDLRREQRVEVLIKSNTLSQK